ncbi:MAG: VCBS repeat-containing protein, partial [bacterium]|nr:VCBS repeat-containing protein [bacterium]
LFDKPTNSVKIIYKTTSAHFLYPVFQVSVLFLGLIGLFSLGCQSSFRNESHANVSASSIAKGKKLAEKHCQSCHQLPDPALLDAKTWETGVLPAMGLHLGITSFGGQHFPTDVLAGKREHGLPTSNAVLSVGEWQNIVNYFTATSPDELPAQARNEKIALELPQFQPMQPKLDYRNSQSCFIKIRENDEARLVVSDAITFMTYFLNEQLVPIDSFKANGPLASIDFVGEGKAVACNVGILRPNEDTLGVAFRMVQKSGKWQADSTNLFSGLRRPIQVTEADLNKDGKEDYLVCEFGYLKGGLSWMENMGNNHFKKHTLSILPGAIKAYILDYDKDGMLDIMALFAQGKEGISLFTNQGNGEFEEKELLSFPAVYGSSYFELADMDKDGKLDIVYTCGDNADYTPILKPYHGVYIFLNKGADHFEQSYFYPIHGCYKAMAMDFDKDGDMDLATIAYFADYKAQPEEGFVYLENKGDLSFKPLTTAKLEAGRWISMDVGDIDDDGWPDILLGNFVQASKFANPAINWADAAPLMILKNKGK